MSFLSNARMCNFPTYFTGKHLPSSHEVYASMYRDLYSKLKYLAETKVMPPIVDEMAYILKKLGNAAAHADDIVFDEGIVNSMIEFTQIILDYVYNIPTKCLCFLEKKNRFFRRHKKFS